MIDGVSVMVTLALADVALATLVPPDRIVAGLLPRGSALPGIAWQSISAIEHSTISAETTIHIVERVQATVLAATYGNARAIIRALRGLDHSMPAAGAITGVVVLLDGAGPDFMEEDARIYGAIQDFTVSYSQTR